MILIVTITRREEHRNAVYDIVKLMCNNAEITLVSGRPRLMRLKVLSTWKCARVKCLLERINGRKRALFLMRRR